VIHLLQSEGLNVVAAQSRLEDRTAMAKELDVIKPTHVVNAAGLTGRPNVDWCEFHKAEVIRVNVVGLLNLADLCEERGIHLTYFGTGCIYEYDHAHPMGSGHGFTENDPPNFHGSFYAHTKAVAEDLIRNYSNVLTLRVRMPLSDDLHPRNFISKITKYERVVNIPNSMTVLHDLLPIAVKMSRSLECTTLQIPELFHTMRFLIFTRSTLIQAFRTKIFPWKNSQEFFKQVVRTTSWTVKNLCKQFRTATSPISRTQWFSCFIG